MADLPEDPDITRFEARLKAFHELNGQARLELATALLARSSQGRGEEAFVIVRSQFPSVADNLARSLAFHAYQEMPDVALSLLAWIELNIREGVHERHAGLDFDLRYHLYNWLQAEALVPYGRQDVFDELAEIRDCLKRNDKKSAAAILDSLIERFETSAHPPDVE